MVCFRILQTRLMAVELTDVLFRRSRVFRGLLAPRLAGFLVGTVSSDEQRITWCFRQAQPPCKTFKQHVLAGVPGERRRRVSSSDTNRLWGDHIAGPLSGPAGAAGAPWRCGTCKVCPWILQPLCRT